MNGIGAGAGWRPGTSPPGVRRRNAHVGQQARQHWACASPWKRDDMAASLPEGTCAVLPVVPFLATPGRLAPCNRPLPR